MEDAGIYITKDGIVGYSLLPDIMLENPREEDMVNISEFYSFDGLEGDYSYSFSRKLQEMKTFEEKKKFLEKELSGQEYLKGVKMNPKTKILELCEKEDATYGLICLFEDCDKYISEDNILSRFSDELKDYSYYLMGQQYYAVKYSFVGEYIESYNYLYGKNPEEANIFYVMGKPVENKYFLDFPENPYLDTEEMIRDGIYLDNPDFFDSFKKKFKGEHLISDIYEFEIDGKKESFGKEEFILELFQYLKNLNNKENSVVSFICNYLLTKIEEISLDWI